MNSINLSSSPTLRRIRKAFTIAVGGLAAALSLAGLGDSASALTLSPVVDQSCIVPVQAALAVTAGDNWGQSFTAGLPGYLTEIDFQLGRQAAVVQPLQVQVRLANGDLPDLDPRASSSAARLPPPTSQS